MPWGKYVMEQKRELEKEIKKKIDSGEITKEEGNKQSQFFNRSMDPYEVCDEDTVTTSGINKDAF